MVNCDRLKMSFFLDAFWDLVLQEKNPAVVVINPEKTLTPLGQSQMSCG